MKVEREKYIPKTGPEEAKKEAKALKEAIEEAKLTINQDGAKKKERNSELIRQKNLKRLKVGIDENEWQPTLMTQSLMVIAVGLDFSFLNSKGVYGLAEHTTSLSLKQTKFFFFSFFFFIILLFF